MSGGTRHYDFAKELVKRGCRVTIFASSFHYSKHQELKEYQDAYFLLEQIDGIDFVWIKTRPYKGNGLGRVINMLEYMYRVQKLVKNIKDRPDAIIGSSVHLFAVYAAYKIAKRLDVPFVMEVRDIWPQTLIDMGVPKWHPFIILLGTLEQFLYKKAKKIITPLPYAFEHIEKFGIKREDIVWISNGVDIDRSNASKPFVFDARKFHITYAGAIGEANQLDALVKAAVAMQKNKDIMFHIIGDGPLRSKLEKSKNSNIVFHGAVGKEEAISMMLGSDILFFPLADSPVFRYGISSNKLFDYLASKKPIIFASTAKNNPIKDANAGVSISPNSEDEIISAIEKLKSLGVAEREKLGCNGFEYVSKYFSIPALVDKLETCLSSLVYNLQKNESI
jgi:glycosyltransferase involved in cell wall biosynthesis